MGASSSGQRTRDWIATEERMITAEGARRPAPPPPDWLIEHGIGTGRPPVRVHTGQCWDTRTRCKRATTDAVRQALAAARRHRHPRENRASRPGRRAGCTGSRPRGACVPGRAQRPQGGSPRM
ncbi:DUF6233 domain-containing protein [Streptomyces sp. NPDC090077]|uniref:DUF6233 domain-containing protein n=1 Tax=Streptomyces sp. NPDC090077 TaxID=3365938 RepID=UPI0038223D12